MKLNFTRGCILLLVFIATSTLASGAYTTGYRYNEGGQLTGIIQPATTAYNASGTAVTTRLAQRNTYNAQALLRLEEYGELADWQPDSIAPAGWPDFTRHRSVRYDYDSYGRRTAVIQQDGNNTPVTITQSSYDNLDRVDCEMVRMSNTLAANACTAQNHGTTQLPVFDRVSKYHYNGNDDIQRIEKAVGTSLAQDYVTYTYHFNGALETTLPATVTDAENNTARYEYDGYGRLEYWYFPSKTKSAGTDNSADYERYEYDNNSNLSKLIKRQKTEAGGDISIIYHYDALNRQTSKLINGTNDSVYYRYNNLGLMTDARFDSNTGQGVIYTYSGFGEVKTEQITIGTTRTLQYQYDKHSNRTRITHPDTQRYFTYGYDALDRLNNIKETGNREVITQTYRTRGTPYETLRHDNRNNVTRFAHDHINRLTDLDWLQNASTFNARDFTYNQASQVESVSTSNHSLVYQGNHNLTGSWQANGLNQISSINGQAYTWSDNGNLESDGASTYTYDRENRLKSAVGAKNISLTYDPLGRLHTTTANGVTTTFLYSGDALVAEYQGNTLTKVYVHGPGMDDPLIEYTTGAINDNSRRYLHKDHQGSIVGMSDSHGNVTAYNTYDAFGIPHENNQGRFSYTGQIYLPELKMYHYKARVYDPKLGRFLQTDPVGYEDQMNLYAYVGNDPMTYVDPEGTNAVRVGARLVKDPVRTVTKAIKLARKALEAIGLINAVQKTSNSEGMQFINGDVPVGDFITQDSRKLPIVDSQGNVVGETTYEDLPLGAIILPDGRVPLDSIDAPGGSKIFDIEGFEENDDKENSEGETDLNRVRGCLMIDCRQSPRESSLIILRTIQ